MPRFSARILNPEDEPQWTALWRRAGGSLGLHWQWCVFAAAQVGEPVRVGVFSSDNQLIAGLPFVQRRRRLRTEWHHPAPASFAGMLAPQDLMNSETALRELFEAASLVTNTKVARTEVVLPSQVQDARGLLWNQWTAQPHYNYISAIRAEGDLARQSENAARRQAAKAMAAGFTFETGRDLRDEILALWMKTRARQNIPVYVDGQCYTDLLDYENDAGDISALAAVVRNPSTKQAEAAAIIGEDSARAYYLLGASELDAGEGTGAPTLLHFQLTDHLFKKRGEFIYDWVGANTPHVAQFKKKFRPALEMYLRCTYRQGMARIIP